MSSIGRNTAIAGHRDMLRSYVTVALKQLTTHKLYSAINVFGLAIGIACFVLIALFVEHELRFDEQWRDADRIYRLSADYDAAAGRPAQQWAGNVMPAAAALVADYPQQIERAARIWGDRVRLARDDALFYEDAFRWADPEIFEIFGFDWVAGDPSSALAEPGSVVLTESLVIKYFGGVSPLGETVVLEGQWPLRVTGVIADLPQTTHLTASAIASPETGVEMLGFDYSGNWSFANFHTYVLLRDGATIEPVAADLRDFVARHKRPFDGVSSMSATNVSDIHLRSNRLGEFRAPGSPANLRAFGLIAICILLTGCINFTNLSTARSARRAREVGIRKTIGAERAQLVRQFLGESIVYGAIATLIAVAGVELLLPAFGDFIGADIDLGTVASPVRLAGLVVLAMLVGVVAGAYPAFILSSFRPVSVLRGELTHGKRGTVVRSALVVLQFSISVTLLIATAIVYSQREFARSIEPGFTTDQIVVLESSASEGFGTRWPALREALLAHPGVSHAVLGSMTPSRLGARPIRIEGGDPNGIELYGKRVRDDFFAAYDIELRHGRVLSDAYASDEFLPPPNGPERRGNFVLNELAAATLGLDPEDAVGKWFEVDFAGDFSVAVRGAVVGVVEDTVNESIHEPIKPLFYYMPALLWGDSPSIVDASVRIHGSQLAATLEHIDAAWRTHMSDQPLSRRFLSEDFRALYDRESRQGRVFAAFTLLAVLIACLGLFGLAALATEQRTKEIGVRKVMGGSVASIVLLLTRDFGKLVLAANLVAWPIGYLAMSRWLEGFAYRIELGPLVFVASAALALGVAALTVGAVAFRAAAANPIHSLRYE